MGDADGLGTRKMTTTEEFEPLFTSSHKWQANTCLNWSHDPLEIYTIGYKEAADRLVDTRHMQDVLIYPICFLYRQYIELRLKEIIHSGRTLLKSGKGFPQHHKINALYQTAKEIIEKVYSDHENPPKLSLVEHIIAEYSRIDLSSFSFRYPFDKFGKNLLEGITHINIRHLSESIKKFGQIIDDIIVRDT